MRLVNFRNHGSLNLAGLSDGVVLVSGANGSGKTSILEAISAFNPGRGLRSELPSWASRDAPKVGGWLAELRFNSPPLLLTMSWDAAVRRRSLFLNRDKKYALADAAAKLPILWLHPGSDRLPSSPPSSRLKFLDRLAAIFDPGHGSRLKAVEKRRTERRRLLAESSADEHWLATLERALAEDAVAIAAARLDLCAQLNRVGDEPKSLPPLRLSVVGIAEELAARMPALAAEDEFAAMLAKRRGDDAFSPWYGGLEFSVGASSTGEQKLLTLSLIFAAARLLQKRLAVSPILLLDELPAHLDTQARKLVMRMCKSLGSQTWLTTAEPNLLASLLPKSSTHLKLPNPLGAKIGGDNPGDVET